MNMSMIVPAGNKKLDWSPKSDVLTKTASTGEVAQEEVNPLYEAAKKYAASLQTPCEKCSKSPCECAVSEVASTEGMPTEGAPTSDAKIEGAVEKIEEAVVELKEAVTGEVDEVEIDIGEPSDAVEVSAIPGEKVNSGEIIVESEPKCNCAATASAKSDVKSDAKSDAKSNAKSDAKSDIKTAASTSSSTSTEKDAKSDSASSDKKEAKAEIVMEKAADAEKWMRLGMISPENRKKVMNYWANMLDYPKDFVALMVKDYEK